MTRVEKANIIEELKDKFSKNAHYYITDASGLTVAQVNNFRRLCFAKGVEYRVFKNTLIKKALDELNTDHSSINDQLKGFSGVIFSEESANVPAKVITEYRKKQAMKKPLLKVASVYSDWYIGEENLKMLSELKSKEELVGEIIALLQSPAKNVISALQSGKNTLGGLIKTLSERQN
jgi:large subunit ribosomal protein L10